MTTNAGSVPCSALKVVSPIIISYTYRKVTDQRRLYNFPDYKPKIISLMQEKSDSAGRLEREKEFHDEIFEQKQRAVVGKYYKAAQTSRKAYEDAIGEITNAKVLEYGCGEGSQAFRLTRQKCEVTGIDISPVAIRVSQDEAHKNGAEAQTQFLEMNAEQLDFPDDHFDAIIGSGILHHLDLNAALYEIQRVLKPNGRAVFFEPMAHNPLVKTYRVFTPSMRSQDEHPLTSSDIKFIQARFKHSDISWHHITSFAAGLLDGTLLFTPVYYVLHGFDTFLMKFIPPARKLSWIVVIDLSAPIKPKPNQ